MFGLDGHCSFFVKFVLNFVAESCFLLFVADEDCAQPVVIHFPFCHVCVWEFVLPVGEVW